MTNCKPDKLTAGKLLVIHVEWSVGLSWHQTLLLDRLLCPTLSSQAFTYNDPPTSSVTTYMVHLA